MSHRNRPLLQVILLVTIGLRTVFGAPCCLPPDELAQVMAADQHDHHGHHAEPANGSETSHGGHSGHGDDPSANPCCSACGPTLPADPTVLTARSAKQELPEPETIRALATRPPYPAYEATGPPLLI